VLIGTFLVLPDRTNATASPCGRPGTPPATYDHVIWIVMENKTRQSVIGAPDAPFETSSAAACATATEFRMSGSPSLPNYLAMTTGGTQGVRDDNAPSHHAITADNLFRQVRAGGGTARSYVEGMPGACALTSSGQYAVKHNPAAYLQGGTDRAACRHDDVPAGTLTDGAFITALRTKTLPTFSFVTPDVCNDTHDCPVATGDGWLRDWVGAITSSRLYAERRTAVFVVWDEETPMPFIAIAPTVDAGTVVTSPIDHYALLRTTEELLGIRAHLGAAAKAPSMRPLFGI
jgi:hypothetical protein